MENPEHVHRIFQWVAGHMVHQGHRAEESDGACVYRDEGGYKCAAGSLIADAHYAEGLEGIGIEPGNDIAYAIEASLGTKLYFQDYHMIRCLQEIHDNIDPYDWARELVMLHARSLKNTIVTIRDGYPIDWLHSYIPKNQLTLMELEEAGYAIAYFSPERLHGAGAEAVADLMVDRGCDAIRELATE